MEAISIVGGGIAGLALAACLDPSRYEVSVYEKRPELPSVGTVLAMWPNAQRALARIGILAGARAVSTVLGNGSIRNAAGRPWITIRGGELFGISRVDLLRLLDGAVPRSVRRVVAQVREVPGSGTLVAGADGVHSVVRREVWGAAADARLSPVIAVRGTIPSSVDVAVVGEYWGRGDLFGIAAAPGGTNWYASWRSELGPADMMWTRLWGRRGAASPPTLPPLGGCWPLRVRSVPWPKGSGLRPHCSPMSAVRRCWWGTRPMP